MKDRIKDYFAFNKKEQRGLIVLLGLMLLSMSFTLFIPLLITDKQYDISPFREEVEKFLAAVEESDSAAVDKSPAFHNDFKENKSPALAAFLASPFDFDPNDLSEEEWRKMGMDDHITRNILRYRQKGGYFRDKEGLKKIYGIDDEIFSILQPFIKIERPENNPQRFKNDFKNVNESSQYQDSINQDSPFQSIIELNSADSASLLDLSGIGPSYAGRMLKYRESLGGYFKKEQILEIKGMDTIRFNQFRNQIIIDTALIRKMDLNTVTFKELLKHPYFEYYLVKAIFNYKDKIVSFDSVAQLKNIPVMYEELFEKISSYLIVDNTKD